MSRQAHQSAAFSLNFKSLHDTFWFGKHMRNQDSLVITTKTLSFGPSERYQTAPRPTRNHGCAVTDGAHALHTNAC